MNQSRRPYSVALTSFRSPTDMAYSSGTPFALHQALSDLTERVVPLAATPPDRLARAALMLGQAESIRDPRTARNDYAAAVNIARLRPPATILRSAFIRLRLRRSKPVDLCIQHGCEYSLGPGIRYVTYEDSTFVQAATSWPWPHLSGLTERDAQRLVAGQRRIYEGALACCTMSKWAAESIVSDYGIAAEKVHVVGVGANHHFEAPVSRKWWPPRYLFVAADWERKNGRRVLDAFEQVRVQAPEATLDIVGRHPAIERPGVREHGFLSLSEPGSRSQLHALFTEATVLVAPSLHDPSPVVHVEAGRSGIGSIGTTNGGAGTVMGDGGILVDPTDEGALVAAMIRLADPEAAADVGHRAHLHAAKLTWSKIAQRLLRAGGLGPEHPSASLSLDDASTALS